MQLNKDNYYSKEADQHYFSVSQYKSFLKCESATLSRILSDYEEPKSEALLFGSYVHSWLDGTIEQFKAENPDLFSTRGATKGELKANYQHANKMISVLESDPFVMFALQGEKEVIMTGELFGEPWKIRMDVYNPDAGRFADLKTVKAMREKYYHPEYGYCSFVEAYGYITQMAIYSEIESQNRDGSWLESYIVAVSKEDPPDKAIITIDNERLALELQEVAEKMERLSQVKKGLIEPKRCEKCYHCRKTKKVKEVIHYMELIG